MGSVKKETISGVKWTFLQKCTLEPLQFIFSLIIARLITPAEFGILGLTSIFFAVAATLASAGLGSAIIRKQDRTEADCSTMFWFNWGMSCLMGATLFLAAPFFAEWYHQPELLWLTRVSALMMTLTCTGSVHWALYSARRDFKTPAIVHTIVSIISMPVCVVFAYLGFGIWAVVIANTTNALLNLVTVWIISPWRPHFIWSTASFKALFGFGSKLAVASLMQTLYTQSRTFIIGKFYAPAQLGYYNRGSHLATLAPQTISSMLESVTYPILATLQHDNARLHSIYQRYIQITSLPIMWAVFTLGALAHPAISFLYGDTWLPAIPYLQILTLFWYCTHVSTINLNLLKVKGESGLLLRLQIVKKVVAIVLMIGGATISVEAVCWAAVISNQFSLLLNCHFCGRLINRSCWQQQLDYLPYAAAALVANIPGFLLTYTPLPAFVTLAFGGLLSVVIYIGIMCLRKDSALREYKRLLESKPYLGTLVRRLPV